MTLQTAYIGIGSNLGDRSRQCRQAIDEVDRVPGCRVTGYSSLYRTEPVGVDSQPWFLNAVIEVEAGIPARVLLDHLLAIEEGMGRRRRGRCEARPIDLDLLLYGAEIIWEPGLTVPHPRLHERRFVLVPLVELNPGGIHPVLATRLKALLEALAEDGQRVEPAGKP